MTNQPKKEAKSGIERITAYRKRIKANKETYEIYKAQDRERKKVERKKVERKKEGRNFQSK